MSQNVNSEMKPKLDSSAGVVRVKFAPTVKGVLVWATLRMPPFSAVIIHEFRRMKLLIVKVSQGYGTPKSPNKPVTVRQTARPDQGIS